MPPAPVTRSPRRTTRIADAPAYLGALGRALQRLFLALQGVRSPRPIHPRGLLLGGDVLWGDRDRASGIEWIRSRS